MSSRSCCPPSAGMSHCRLHSRSPPSSGRGSPGFHPLLQALVRRGSASRIALFPPCSGPRKNCCIRRRKPAAIRYVLNASIHEWSLREWPPSAMRRRGNLRPWSAAVLGLTDLRADDSGQGCAPQRAGAERWADEARPLGRRSLALEWRRPVVSHRPQAATAARRRRSPAMASRPGIASAAVAGTGTWAGWPFTSASSPGTCSGSPPSRLYWAVTLKGVM